MPVIYRDGCHLSIADTESPECAFGDTASATTVVLLGDSHAAQWFPTLRRLAEKNGWRLLVRTKSGCPAPDVTILQRRLSRPTTSATRGVRGARRAGPDHAGPRRRGRDAHRLARRPRHRATTDRVVGGGRRVEGRLAAHPRRRSRRPASPSRSCATPRGRARTWPSCVDRNRSEPSACDVSRKALDSPAYDVRTASGSPTAHGVDLSDVICDADRCPATRGKYLVYRDTDHLTATFARALAPYLDEQLAPLLP